MRARRSGTLVFRRSFVLLSILACLLLALVVVVPFQLLFFTNTEPHNNPSNADILHSPIARTTTGPQLWETASFGPLPPWMKNYFSWHSQERLRLAQFRATTGNYNQAEKLESFRFLVLQCLPGSRKCGGTADRLQPLPLFLWIAHQTNRVLLIKWGRPAQLEEYLLPPRGGLDWRVPDWLYHMTAFRQGPRATNLDDLLQLTAHASVPIVKVRFQAHDHGATYYNSQRPSTAELTFEQVYRYCWRVLFTPAPSVAQLIHDQLQALHLQPGRYVGIHLRALYAVTDRDPAIIDAWAQNAVRCASQLDETNTNRFFIASDSALAKQTAVQYGQGRVTVVASQLTQPFHLDKAPKSATVSDFYDTFVDLYLLSMSRCITYGMGGFGAWAGLISHHVNNNNNKQEAAAHCAIQHHNAQGLNSCDWAATGSASPGRGEQLSPQAEISPVSSLFLPPMTP